MELETHTTQRETWMCESYSITFYSGGANFFTNNLSKII